MCLTALIVLSLLMMVLRQGLPRHPFEILELAGLLTALVSLPLSFLLIHAPGGIWLYAITLLAPTVNWALLGLFGGWVVSWFVKDGDS